MNMILKTVGVLTGIIILTPYAFTALYRYTRLKSSIEFVNPKLGCVKYTLRGQKYTILIPIRRGPNTVIEVRDDTSDVTTDIRPYLGPNEDFHQVKVTPRMLGYKILHFFLQDEEVRIFKDDEPIVLDGK